MRTDYRESNAAHQESIDVYEKFIASGGKVITDTLLKRQYIKGTINEPTANKTDKSLAGMSDLNKVLTVLRKHSKLTRKEVAYHSGVGAEAISRATKRLINCKSVKRLMGEGTGLGKQVTYSYIGDE